MHDVDHQAVLNTKLIVEANLLTILFNSHSVAKKHLSTVMWGLLMEDRFSELWSLVFVNGNETRRSKGSVVNKVLATKISG